MEKIKKHENAIIEIVSSFEKNGAGYHVIIDKKNRHYQVLSTGWDKKNSYFCRILIHFHLREDGIICLFENHTEMEIADVLMDKGISKSNILVNFLPQSARQYAGYAVA